MKTPFNKIRIAQLYNLCTILSETKIHHLSYIKDKYLENGLWFDETLSFLKDLKIITISLTELIPSKIFFRSFSTISNFKKQLLTTLINSKGILHDHIYAFLVNFRKENGEILYYPTQADINKFSDIRNLLQELDFIVINKETRKYYIKSDLHYLFFEFICRKGISSDSLKSKLEENDVLGLKAEEKVIEYELNRLTNIILKKNEIEHTSKINVLAGYDIKSFENYLDNNLIKIARYIEVKAVSSHNYNFYWSRNEKESAFNLGESYYLYLLPVTTNHNFDISKMKIINDPFKNVYMNKTDWTMTEECVSFKINN